MRENTSKNVFCLSRSVSLKYIVFFFSLVNVAARDSCQKKITTHVKN